MSGCNVVVGWGINDIKDAKILRDSVDNSGFNLFTYAIVKNVISFSKLL